MPEGPEGFESLVVMSVLSKSIAMPVTTNNTVTLAPASCCRSVATNVSRRGTIASPGAIMWAPVAIAEWKPDQVAGVPVIP